MPGLIEGASEGVGLGHEFLAHLERARLLVHVIDAAAEDPRRRFETINLELAAYGAGLDERPQIVVANKIDLLPESPSLTFDDPRVLRVLPVSCATGAGIEELKRALFALCPEVAPPPAAAEDDELVDFLVYRPAPKTRPPYRILRTERGFRVAGTPPAGEELEQALRAAGARRGSEVEVGGETHELP